MAAFYVTTPIYYANDRPHIGTAYSTIAADVIARYHRLLGQPTRFVTGLDEHGLKLERRAQELGQSPQDFVDGMAQPFRDAWHALGCAYDDFVRTTEPRHKERAQELWRRCMAAGDIFEGEYEGHYCVGCEAYYTEKDLLEGGLCPQHKKPVEKLKEKSFFFRLSAYAEKLLKFYDDHPDFVQPAGRFNEVKSFVREGLKDISVSRTTFEWGVPVPDHPEHVMYVWFDALTNYISVLGGPERVGEVSELFTRFWPRGGGGNAKVVHIVGKDILRFHAIYWPAFLMSAGLEPPSQVWAHGWLTVNGDKMSKSLGNFLEPGPLVDAVGHDVLRYYLMRDVAFGQDGDFSHDNLFARYHGDLGNGLGNLLHRLVASIVKKSLGGQVPAVDFAALPEPDRALVATAERAAQRAREHYERVQPNRALEAIWELVTATNRYVDQMEPWKLAKDGAAGRERLEQVSYAVLESLRWLSLMLWPVMPDKCDDMRRQLGLAAVEIGEGHNQWPSVWGGLAAGTHTAAGKPLFPRFEPDAQAALIDKLKPKTSPSPAQAPAVAPLEQAEPLKDHIVFDDFLKLDLRVAAVVKAERVPKSKKLLQLQVSLGPLGERQILAGIGQHFSPEELLGKHVVVVANLPPRKMMGRTSEGMVLAAGDGSRLSVLQPLVEMPPGSTVS